MEKKKDEEPEPEGEVFESLDEILKIDDSEYKKVKAWGGKPARLGSLTAMQMVRFLENNDKPEQRRRNGLILIAQSLVDSKGKRLVNTENEEELNKAIEQLKGRASKTNGEVVQHILKLNGLLEKDALAIAKNVSGEVPTGSSPTDSPEKGKS